MVCMLGLRKGKIFPTLFSDLQDCSYFCNPKGHFSSISGRKGAVLSNKLIVKVACLYNDAGFIFMVALVGC